MKKAIGLVLLIGSLMVGGVTAYAAPSSAVTGPGCEQGISCEQYECMRDGVCTYTDCPYHGTTVYDGNGCQLDHTHNSNCSGTTVYDGNGCQLDHTHNGNCSGTTTSHHRGRGHHGRGHC